MNEEWHEFSLVESAPSGTGIDTLAIVKAKSFHNGTIDLWIAGAPGPDAAPDARGFVGVAFRVAENPEHYEAMYLRPTNGRAEDQLRRNHSTQYISQPEYPWERLRKESPGVYESYADMVSGDWIHCCVVVAGTQARLFLGSASQPSLVVKDLKHGDEVRESGVMGRSGDGGLLLRRRYQTPQLIKGAGARRSAFRASAPLNASPSGAAVCLGSGGLAEHPAVQIVSPRLLEQFAPAATSHPYGFARQRLLSMVRMLILQYSPVAEQAAAVWNV